jgi:polyhydroxyalkanoate synthesis regulator phasin
MEEPKMMPEDFFKRNLEMWEQYTSTYMDTMFKAVEKTMQQSQAFKDQLDTAVSDTVSTQMDATMATLQALQRQVENLSEKVDKLMEKEEAS